MTRNEGSALFLMWAYWDHPHTRTPGCPVISSRGQPFLPLSKHVSYATILFLCPSLFSYMSSVDVENETIKYTCFSQTNIVPYSNFVSNTSFFSLPSIQKKVLLLLQSLSRRTRHLCVTSGFAPTPGPSSFPGRIIPFKLQSYLRPILSPRPPAAIKLFIQRTSCHPALS